MAYIKLCELREHPNSKAVGNPEPSPNRGRCNDYPKMEYTSSEVEAQSIAKMAMVI